MLHNWMRNWGSIAWIRTKMTNFILALHYAKSFTCYLQDSTEGDVFILYNHNFNLQMTKTWARHGEASFNSVLVINIGDPSLITCVIYHPDRMHFSNSRVGGNESKWKKINISKCKSQVPYLKLYRFSFSVPVIPVPAKRATHTVQSDIFQ